LTLGLQIKLQMRSDHCYTDLHIEELHGAYSCFIARCFLTIGPPIYTFIMIRVRTIV